MWMRPQLSLVRNTPWWPLGKQQNLSSLSLSTSMPFFSLFMGTLPPVSGSSGSHTGLLQCHPTQPCTHLQSEHSSWEEGSLRPISQKSMRKDGPMSLPSVVFLFNSVRLLSQYLLCEFLPSHSSPGMNSLCPAKHLPQPVNLSLVTLTSTNLSSTMLPSVSPLVYE